MTKFKEFYVSKSIRGPLKNAEVRRPGWSPLPWEACTTAISSHTTSTLSNDNLQASPNIIMRSSVALPPSRLTPRFDEGKMRASGKCGQLCYIQKAIQSEGFD